MAPSDQFIYNAPAPHTALEAVAAAAGRRSRRPSRENLSLPSPREAAYDNRQASDARAAAQAVADWNAMEDSVSAAKMRRQVSEGQARSSLDDMMATLAPTRPPALGAGAPAAAPPLWREPVPPISTSRDLAPHPHVSSWRDQAPDAGSHSHSRYTYGASSAAGSNHAGHHAHHASRRGDVWGDSEHRELRMREADLRKKEAEIRALSARLDMRRDNVGREVWYPNTSETVVTDAGRLKQLKREVVGLQRARDLDETRKQLENMGVGGPRLTAANINANIMKEVGMTVGSMTARERRYSKDSLPSLDGLSALSARERRASKDSMDMPHAPAFAGPSYTELRQRRMQYESGDTSSQTASQAASETPRDYPKGVPPRAGAYVSKPPKGNPSSGSSSSTPSQLRGARPNPQLVHPSVRSLQHDEARPATSPEKGRYGFNARRRSRAPSACSTQTATTSRDDSSVGGESQGGQYNDEVWRQWKELQKARDQNLKGAMREDWKNRKSNINVIKKLTPHMVDDHPTPGTEEAQAELSEQVANKRAEELQGIRDRAEYLFAVNTTTDPKTVDRLPKDIEHMRQREAEVNAELERRRKKVCRARGNEGGRCARAISPRPLTASPAHRIARSPHRPLRACARRSGETARLG